MEHRIEVLPGIFIQPQSIKTIKGLIEYDITKKENLTILCSHGGIALCVNISETLSTQ
ncbi:MAG: hypothetical protein Q7J27_05465 [Syntrophales bacterium]|nr:hypothetical protein [Syntrophales bacterium]